MNKQILAAFAAFTALMLAGAAHAQLTIGATLTATGTNASIGIPIKNALEIMPKTIGGVPVRLVLMDDGGDPSVAVRNMRKLVQEDKIDVIIGSSSTPTCLALADTALETRTPQLCQAPIVVRNKYVFFVPQSVQLMVEGIVLDMKKRGVKSVGFIGFSDGWGDLNFQAFAKLAEPAGIKILAAERYARTDTSVTAQMLKIVATNPDAVFVGAASTPAALPSAALQERGYKGPVYHTHGVLSPDFLRVGGKAVEGIIAPAGPIIVRDQLPDSNPVKKAALDFAKLYEGKYGPRTLNPFAAHGWDSILILERAVPIAAKKAKPGTVEFRDALRDAIEGVKEVVATQGVFNMTPNDHNGFDGRARVMVQVNGGMFKLIQ